MPEKNKPTRFVTSQQKIAVERMHRLCDLAAEQVNENPARSKRYGELIKELSMRFRIAVPKEIRSHFCKHCNNYWIEGKTVTRRMKNGTWNSVCKICGKLTRRKVN